MGGGLGASRYSHKIAERKMKSLLIIIFLATFIFNANAQIISSYGFKLGVGISNQSWHYQSDLLNFDWKDKIGITTRIFADFLSISFFNVEGEIGYLRKGFKDKVPITSESQPDGTGEYITTNNSLDYLNISALAKFKYDMEIFTPYVVVGPQLNLLLNRSVEQVWEDFFDKFKDYNIGLSIGVGSELKITLPITILLEYRYERDFLDNYKVPNIDIKNYSHVILLGIKI